MVPWSNLGLSGCSEHLRWPERSRLAICSSQCMDALSELGPIRIAR